MFRIGVPKRHFKIIRTILVYKHFEYYKKKLLPCNLVRK